MTSASRSESAPLPLPGFLPQKRNWGRILLAGVVGMGLFSVALAGLWQMVLHFTGNNKESAWTFFLAVDLTVIPLLLLGVLVGSLGRSWDRARLAAGFQARLDQLQNRLSYREDLLRLVADHQSGAIAIFDQHNRYWFVNQHAANRLGKPASEIIGKPPFRVLSGEQARRLELRLAEARAAAAPVERVDQIVNERGETRFIQTHFEAIAPFAELTGGVLASEDDLTTLIVERERRERMLKQVIETLVAVVDRRDPYAAGHSARVGVLARAIAEEMGLDPLQAEAAEIAGSLMNFGKVLVSRHILTKTTALTPEELQRVRDSILTSADILAIIGFDVPVVPTLRQVLERYDGSGVPEGLQGEAILVTARVVAVANAFVAMVSPRAHRDGLDFTEAMKRLHDDSGTLYDPRVLTALSHALENHANKMDWLLPTRQA